MVFPKVDYTNLFVVQCPIVIPENIHTSYIMPTVKVIFRIINVYTNTSMHTITISIKRSHELEAEKGEFGGRKEMREML